ncbi:hypothetical protein LTR36_000255 [Oleoguttula mirabilis]|uniref:F-box domain-containing protein n=1 Tax=Oleoguttula mirabilis TaxID=1507867 RepID=A0AAV9JYL2_9PEZI|nr:hypothetical protein LTR36_000255 [Oleoguttula mirabilis]
MENTSQLLDLPPELRSLIYSQVALGAVDFTLKSDQNETACTQLFIYDPGLVLASHQVHDEYVQIAEKIAVSPNADTTFTTKVDPLCFGHVVRFLDGLSAKAINDINHTSKLHIYLCDGSLDEAKAEDV